MNHHPINVLGLALGLAFSAGAMAQSLSKAEYKAGKDSIAAGYKSAKADCASLSGNANDICLAEAKGKESIARAELETRYKPSVKTRYDVSVAKARATYAVAKERCDDLAGNPKDVCVKEAKAARTSAEADAKAQMKTSEANATAAETSAEARSKASSEAADARRDAATDKRDAEYEVAKKKCDALAGDAKDQCLSQAKLRLGKS